MSLRNGPSPRYHEVQIIDGTVKSERQTKQRSTGIAGKLERTFYEALDANSFDTHAFAFMVTKMPAVMQKRMLEIIVHFCRIHNDNLANGAGPYATEEEYDLMVNAKRVYGALSPFHF